MNMNFKDIIKKSKIPKLQSRNDFPILIRQMGYKKICEIGVNRGGFLSILSLGDPDHLVGVDVWDVYDQEAYEDIPGYYKLYPHNMNKVWRERAQAWAERTYLNVDIIVDFSVEAAKQFEDGYFDFVYIDASHTYEAVVADLEAWYPKIRKGGMIAGHDYHNVIGFAGKRLNCKDGIDDFAKKVGKEDALMITMKDWPTSFFFVK
jgi:hypothetical protein